MKLEIGIWIEGSGIEKYGTRQRKTLRKEQQHGERNDLFEFDRGK